MYRVTTPAITLTPLLRMDLIHLSIKTQMIIQSSEGIPRDISGVDFIFLELSLSSKDETSSPVHSIDDLTLNQNFFIFLLQVLA